MGRAFRIVNQPRDFEVEGSLGRFVTTHGVEVLSYANANLAQTQTLPSFRGFHVVRDPRDVLVSAYFSHKKTHGTTGWPELIAHRKRLQSMPKHDGLLAEMEFSAPFFEDMLTWDYDQENVLELKMEEVTAHPVEHFLTIATFLSILTTEDTSSLAQFARRIAAKANRWNHRGRRLMPGSLPLFPIPRRPLDTISGKLVTEIVEARTFEKLTGRKKGQEDRNTHLRKGVPGDWVNHFDSAHVRAFKDRYNDLLLKLGYEDTPNW
jgi:hypothetical protein